MRGANGSTSTPPPAAVREELLGLLDGYADALAQHGKSVIMISSELPEVVGMSDRILVMHEGREVGMIDRKDASQEAIMALCV